MSRTPVMDERMRSRRASVADADVRRRRRRLASLAAAVGLLLAAVLLARSPLFSVTEVRVEGVASDRAGEVRHAAAIRIGDNLLDVDLEAAGSRVTALPWVADAQARPSPPSAVTLHVTARQPVAVARAADAAWLVDTEGIVIGGGAADHLPVIEVADADVPPVGEPVTGEALRNALAVHTALPAPVRELVDRYAAPSVSGLRLRLRTAGDGGMWVRFGAAEAVEAKARAIGFLVEEVERRAEGATGEEPGDASPERTEPAEPPGSEAPIDPDAVELDVRAPNNPVVVLEPEPGPGESADD